MERVVSGFVLGYHGCDQEVAELLLRDSNAFKPSNNRYDWLGGGMYFWEANPQRGLEFAKEVMHRAPDKITVPTVVGAVIDLGLCLNLTSHADIEYVNRVCEEGIHPT